MANESKDVKVNLGLTRKKSKTRLIAGEPDADSKSGIAGGRKIPEGRWQFRP